MMLALSPWAFKIFATITNKWRKCVDAIHLFAFLTHTGLHI